MSTSKLISFLAIDLGATSGRAILGSIGNNRLELTEINRFPNPIIDVNGRLHWDLFHLYNEIIKSLKLLKRQSVDIQSLGIDTWGVDFVCFGKDGEPLRMPYSYRDPYTVDSPERFFKRITKKEVYMKTGNQIMNFNSLFQISAQRDANSSILPMIDKILFMPDALSYMLTGSQVTEYTIASTSQMVNPFKKIFDETLLNEVGLTKNNFAEIVFAGAKIGTLSDSVKRQTGMNDIPVIAVAGHDTASAIIATPAENANFIYLSSGTWSLMGIESETPVINDKSFELNFTNEGGADGSTRLLKNICGMWLIEQCKKEWDKEREVSYNEIVHDASIATPFKCYINPDATCFSAPESMIKSIKVYCEETNQFVPQTMGEIARCIYESLAFRYKQTFEDLQQLADFKAETLHIIGGGSQNNMLNSFTANAIGIPVVAGPSEATAMGNILLQAQAYGLVADKNDIRKIVRNSVGLLRFEPENSQVWNKHYLNYLKVYR